MPTAFLYLAVMLGVILLWFILLKRPIYEAVLLSFLVLMTVTGTWGSVGRFALAGLNTSLLYSMTAFMAMSVILTKTKVIDSCIAVILSLFGRVAGGAGYVTVIASAFMGALSGSGPGNVMATGTITIPVMKKAGFPAELAANIQSNASTLGNMIPPSANIVAAMGVYTALYPEAELNVGRFWLVLWGASLWFILQRLVTVYVFCRVYKVKPMDKSELPDLKTVLKEGRRGLLLPVIILLPFLLDYLFKDTFFTARLGAAGAKYFSSSLLLFTAGIASLYGCLIAPDKKAVSPKKLAEMFAGSVKSIVPTIAVCIFGYMIGALFNEANVAPELEAFVLSFSFTKLTLVLFVCVITCLLGMVIVGSSMIVIFGSVFITLLAAAGVDPLLAAAMLPCICGVMSGITPPLGLVMYAGMTLAGSDFDKTVKNNLWWVALQFLMQVAVLMGWLPIPGL